jgi:hypothetical protein
MFVLEMAFPDPTLEQGLGQLFESSPSILARFSAVSVDFSCNLNWLLRFASNWTYIPRSSGEAAQSRCRSCLKARLLVYPVSNTGKRAPIGKPADGTISFFSGGSRCSPRLHASVTPTD